MLDQIPETMKSFGLEASDSCLPFWNIEENLFDEENCQLMVDTMLERLDGNRFGILLVEWEINGDSHAMVIEGNFCILKYF